MEPTPGSSGGASAEPKKKFECPVCPRSFNVWWNLAAHYSVHQRAGEVAPGSRPPGYERDHGKYLTQAEGSLKEEEDRRNGQAFMCVTCDVAFSKQELLAWHMSVKHAGEKVEPVQESSGQQSLGSTSTSAGLNEKEEPETAAQRSSSEIKSSQCPCPVCGKIVSKANLARHVKTVHSEVKPYKCRICSKRFNTRDNLKRHMTAVHSLTSREPSKPKSR